MMHEMPELAVVNYLYMQLGGLMLLNMLIGIICEIIATTKWEEEQRILYEKVLTWFELIDWDGGGTISRDEYNEWFGILEVLNMNLHP